VQRFREFHWNHQPGSPRGVKPIRRPESRFIDPGAQLDHPFTMNQRRVLGMQTKCRHQRTTQYPELAGSLATPLIDNPGRLQGAKEFQAPRPSAGFLCVLPSGANQEQEEEQKTSP
jgi:hypothetical protein